MNWTAPQKPAEFSETRLIEAILDGRFPIGSSLPAERELAAALGVTRPTLREALQRLARDGWIEIRHGRPTRVRDYWHEGNLAVLGVIAHHSDYLPSNFVSNLLVVRQLMAPAYTRLAVEQAPAQVVELLQAFTTLEDSAEAYAAADWTLHHRLTIASGNPVFTLILNGFCDLYHTMACIYFRPAPSRLHSSRFYASLLAAAQSKDVQAAEQLTRSVMQDSLELWQAAVGGQPPAGNSLRPPGASH
ncbi:MAG TPA: fatty acid metabolism transcriptional regulator FadR [Anaerolineales bacterium]